MPHRMQDDGELAGQGDLGLARAGPLGDRPGPILQAIFPNLEAVVRLVGALMLEQNDEWAVSRRYMPVEKLTAMCQDPDTAAMIAAQ